MSRRVRGLAISRAIVYGNTAVHLTAEEAAATGHSHRWTVCVRSATSPPPEGHEDVVPIGGEDDLSYFIKKVSFKLHDTYPNPTRTIDRPPFEVLERLGPRQLTAQVTETGWGEFDIIIKLFFAAESTEKPLQLVHHLKLHPWGVDTFTGPTNILPLELKPIIAAATAEPSQSAPPAPAADGSAPAQPLAAPAEPVPQLAPEPPLLPPPQVIIPSPVYSYQYDEIVFMDPPEAFYNLMCQYPATPLPDSNRRLEPEGTPVHPTGPNGNVGELSLETEAFEGRRLDRARLTALAEVDRWRTRLLELERARGQRATAAVQPAV